MTTLNELFPGNMGRVRLTRVALKLRMPALLSMAPDLSLEPPLLDKVARCLEEVQKG